MKKDFSAYRKETLLQMVETVEPPENFSDPCNWFDGSQSEIMTYVNNAGITNIINRRDVLKNSIHDKNMESARQIEKIYEKALLVDDEYKGYFDGHISNLTKLGGFISKFSNAISVSSPGFCKASKITFDTKEAKKFHKNRVVEDYEREHPDVKANMDKAFVNMENGYTYIGKDGGSHDVAGDPDAVTDIKYIAYTSEEPYRSLITKHIGDVKIEYPDIQAGGGSQFETHSMTIYYKWDDPGAGTSDPRGAYVTFYHEFGHYLDYIYGPDSKNLTAVKDFDGITLDESIDNDVYNVVSRKVAETYPQSSDEFKKDVTDRLTKGNLPGYVDDDDEDVIIAAKKVQAMIYDDMRSAKAEGISDAYDGSTNYLINETTHREYDLDEEYLSPTSGKGVAGSKQHHNSYYYLMTREGKTLISVDKPHASAASEGFATFFSNKTVGYEEYSHYYEEYLPTTVGYYEEVIKYMSETELP